MLKFSKKNHSILFKKINQIGDGTWTRGNKSLKLKNFVKIKKWGAKKGSVSVTSYRNINRKMFYAEN